MTDDVVILDAARPEAGLCPPARWQAITDQVMGGVSRGAVALEDVAGVPALLLSGTVSLENNGGFIQMACDLSEDGGPFDASGLAVLRVWVYGDGADYGIHLRTTDLMRPWQSYRLAFRAPPAWTEVSLPLGDAAPHRTDAPFRPDRLRRLGVVAIGRSFQPRISISRITLSPARP